MSDLSGTYTARGGGLTMAVCLIAVPSDAELCALKGPSVYAARELWTRERPFSSPILWPVLRTFPLSLK